ncbi:hypothetical protein KAR91_47955 [Candidatus Pacearchaeota archaeon]|nr:hypothetical protein [Candidatus Pacearchaeota archaeon]
MNTSIEDICNAMNRAASALEIQVDKMIEIDRFDYRVEFPSEDARMIREGIELLKNKTGAMSK